MKNERHKIGDLLLILIILGTAFLSAFLFRQQDLSENRMIVILQDGQEIYRLPFGRKIDLLIDSGNGSNRIMADQESVWMEEADCPDLTCIKQGKITDGGQMIVCLPHKLIIYLEGIKNDSPDVILN